MSHDHDPAQADVASAPLEDGALAHRDLHSHLRNAREELEHQVARTRENFEEANERITARAGRNLVLAVGIGIGLIAVVLGALLIQKEAFILLAVAGALLGVFELVRALQVGGRKLDVAPQLIVAASLVIVAYFGHAWLLWVVLFTGVAFIVVWRTIGQMSERDGRMYGDVLSDVLVGAFLPIYVPFMAALAMMLLSEPRGEYWVLMFLAVTIAADTGAYGFGLWLGKHPLAPRVSPKKTWEGFGGAVVTGVAAAVFLCMWLLNLPWWAGVISGVVIVVVATLGDLGESLIKRDLGIKDMSSWLPGHGGLLDRLDSVLPSAAAALALHFFLAPFGTA